MWHVIWVWLLVCRCGYWCVGVSGDVGVVTGGCGGKVCAERNLTLFFYQCRIG